MTHPDLVLIRAKDIGLIIGIVTLCGMLWKVGAKPFEWEKNSEQLAELKIVVNQHERQLIEIQTQYQQIHDELVSINRKLGR